MTLRYNQPASEGRDRSPDGGAADPLRGPLWSPSDQIPSKHLNIYTTTTTAYIAVSTACIGPIIFPWGPLPLDIHFFLLCVLFGQLSYRYASLIANCYPACFLFTTRSYPVRPLFTALAAVHKAGVADKMRTAREHPRALEKCILMHKSTRSEEEEEYYS